MGNLAAGGLSAGAGDGLRLRRVYGLLIDALKIPAFIITLAGMFFLRGVSYLVSEESIPINHPVYDTLSGLAWTIPGGGRLSAMGLLMLLVVVAGILSPIAPALATCMPSAATPRRRI